MAITTAFKLIQRGIIGGKRYLVVDGGTGAGKTYDTMGLIAGYCTSFPEVIFTVLGKSHKHLERGAIRDFQSNMREMNQWDKKRWNETKSIYTFANNSILEFISADDMDAHGPKRDGLFVNEANAVKWTVFDQLATRTKDLVIIDFNPTAKFWAHTELLEKIPDKCEHITLTYKDNEALSEQEIANIEEKKPKDGEAPSNWWRVYGMGLLGSLEGNVYEGWIPVDEKPEGFVLKRYGVDFGFSNDPTAVVAVYENDEGEIYLETILCQNKLLTPVLVEKLKALEPALFVCDNARPEIIAELQANGIRAIGCDKTPGEKMNGKRYNIELVLRRKIYYNSCDKELEQEYLSYAWRTKRTGEVLDEPEDGNDHCLTGDTMVDTVHGQKKIKDLVGTSGYVFSESGKIRKYRNVRQTGIEDTIKITFDNGNTLECSKEHPIYTVNRGIVPAYLLNEQDLIQCIMYEESKNNIEYQTTVQRDKLLERGKRKILSQRTAQTARSTQSGLGILQWKNTEGVGDRPYRQRYGKQPDREFKSSYAVRKQQECIRRDKNKKGQECTKSMPKNESMARFRNREGMALRAWQESLREERTNRHHLCSLWEKVLYDTIFKKSAFVQPSLPAKETQKSKKRATDGLRRENNKEMPVLRKCVSHIFPKAEVLLPEMQRQGKVCKIVKIEDTGKNPVYCMDVFDTSNFSVNGGIIVSNCMDAIAYAIRDMARKPIEYGGVVYG